MRNTYPKYNTTNIAWLPQVPIHWELRKTKYLFNLITKQAPINNSLELLSVYTEIGVKPRKELEEKGNKASTTDLYWMVNKYDIIVNKLLAWMGAIGISNYDGVTSPAYDILRKRVELNPFYYDYMFRCGILYTDFKRRSKGIMEMRLRLYFDEFGQIVLPYPPLKEQNNIVNYLDTQIEQINRFISKKQKLIELLKEQKQTVVNKYLENDFPLIKLKYLIKGKLKYGANESGEEYNEAYPRYIRITDFGANGNLKENEKLSLKPEVAHNYLLKDGDILFARSGGTVGKTFQFKYSDNSFVACYAGYLIKAEPDSKKILSDFLFYYTQSGLYERWKDAIFNKATIENIGADKYSQLLIPVPSLQEQKKILINIKKETGNIDAVINRTEKEIDIIKEYKQSLIAEVVTGKIKVV